MTRAAADRYAGRMRYLVLLALVGGCAMGAPPGFATPGDTWTVPLVDPLAGGRLIVPVMVEGHGPYLFAIDRDSGTVVDPEVINETGVRVEGGVRLDDYHDTSHPGYWAELTNVEIGSLVISLVPVDIVERTHMFDEDGRRIAGILGKDFLADSIVFGFDRDRGIAWVQTQEAFKPPPGAMRLETTKSTSAGTKVAYFPVLRDAKVAGVPVDLHVDFSMVTSQLARARWQPGGLRSIDWGLDVIDESGTRRSYDKIGVAPQVTVGPVTREGVGFVAYDDRRLWWAHLDGTLGLDFFRPYKVASDWHHEVIYLTPRDPEPASRALRLARWGAQIPACPHPACVAVILEDQILHVLPDPGVKTPLEVVVAATSASGHELPMLTLNLPPGSPPFDDNLDTRYLGAKLEVVDVSPFPRICPQGGACVLRQAPLPP